MLPGRPALHLLRLPAVVCAVRFVGGFRRQSWTGTRCESSSTSNFVHFF
jgi:hypothetical protein